MENILTGLGEELDRVIVKFNEEISIIRGNRPSVELVENIGVEYFDQRMTIKQLGSISIQPPRDILINIWDKNAVGPVMKAIEEAKIGLGVSNEGNIVRASLSTLTDERRTEMTKLAKKTSENARIQVRNRRDETIKKIKSASDKKEMNEDEVFKLKEKIQVRVDEANKKIEEGLEKKIREIKE